MKAIALLARGRSQLMPDLPTAHEQGLSDFEANAWSGLFLPKGTPAAIVSKLNLAAMKRRTPRPSRIACTNSVQR